MRGILKFVLETQLHADVTELESEEKALLFLKNLQTAPSMIVYDYTSNAYLLEDFVTYLRAHQKSVRIIVLVSEVRQEGLDMLKNLDQIKLMNEAALPGALVEDASKIFGGTSHVNDEPYCRISLNFLSVLDGINKNLYIKIGADKFIKISHEDDDTNLVDITKYRSKGIEYLYLARQTAVWVINQIEGQINIFLKANNFRFVLRGANESPEKRFEQRLLRINDEVHVDKEFKETIEKAITRIRAVVEKDTKVDEYLKHFKQKQDEYALFTQKMNLTSVLSCALAKELEWISKTTMDKLVFASVLCDITLAVRPELLMISGLPEFNKVKDTFSEEDQRIFLTHPKDAANLIKRYFTTAPPDTDALAYQHHEQPDGTGFPQGLKADRISPLAALFIVANDFAYYYLRDDEPTLDEFLLRSHGKYDYVNFRKIIKALEKVKKK
jgi:HD-GYP domain-containing protein (c-di-GMP phosphodiesterase class II)